MSSENSAWGRSPSDHGRTMDSQTDQQDGSRWHKEYQRTGGGLYKGGNQSQRGRGSGGGRGGRGGIRGRGGYNDSFNNRTDSSKRQQARTGGDGDQQTQQTPNNSSSDWNTSSSGNSNNDGWSTVTISKPSSTQSTAAHSTNEGWSTKAAPTTTNTNDAWGATASNTNDGWSNTSSNTNGTWSKAADTTNDSWSTTSTSANKTSGSWAGATATPVPATNTKDSWTAPSTSSKDSWSFPQTTTDVQADSWSSGMTTGQQGWNPTEVSWMKTMDEPEKKEKGRGEWKDGQHIIAERDIETEKKLFGETEADFVHSGINFDQYDNIPIKVESKTVFEPMNMFTSPPLNEHLLSNIRLAQYLTPTPVQKYSVPIVMSGRDLMACAQTGSGKTAGFLFPVLSRLFNEGPQEVVEKKDKGGSSRDSQKAYPEILILAPTRELASQIYKETKKFCYRSFVRPCVAYGGADIGQQLRLLGRGCQVLVATPGRLVDILERRRLSLKNIRYLVLDEADRMLDMGFEPQIRRIVQGEDMPEPTGRHTLMFSATFPKSIQALAKEFLNDYVFFTVGKVGGTSENIKQQIIYVEDKNKQSLLLETLEQNGQGAGLTLVFVETKRMADTLCGYLVGHGKKATVIHGDRLQREREEALQAFRSGEVPILVATAVAARGLDIPNVTHVISYDVPKDIDDYTHRIGRTGRAGNTGLATAFFERRNRFIAADMVGLLKEANQTIPDWLQSMADEPLPTTNYDDYPRRRQQQKNYDSDNGIGVRIKSLKF